MGGELIRLTWEHPQLGTISEVVCPGHDADVRAALFTLGIGCFGNDGTTVNGFAGPGEIPVCLRCQAHPAMLPRQLLRQWFGEGAS